MLELKYLTIVYRGPTGLLKLPQDKGVLTEGNEVQGIIRRRQLVLEKQGKFAFSKPQPKPIPKWPFGDYVIIVYLRDT